jgi:MFS family permease
MLKKILPLSLIISMRFFGLFIVLPVLSIYALSMPNATPAVVGIIIGGYAITQMIFQIPFGAMSDILGRKGTIITGLLLFAIGSIICAVADSILALLLGRLLQGAGAIGAVVSAMISDLVKEEQRAKAMAVMGGSIAAAFAIAMVLGPLIGGYAGVSVLFWISAFIALASIYVLIKMVPNTPIVTHTYQNESKFAFLANRDILKMNITNFLQKGLMTFAFMIIPIILTNSFNWDMTDLWKIYIPAMVVGVISMGPAVILSEKKGMFKQVIMIGIIFFALSYYVISGAYDEYMFLAGIIIFFIGFNMHEPIIQSLTTKYAKVYEKGKVLGYFNTFGYAGTFIGGFVGGLYFQEIDGSFSTSLENISNMIVFICILWLGLVSTLPNPLKKKNIYFNLDEIDKNKLDSLDNLQGCDEWYINNTENLLIVKYSVDIISEDDIDIKI